MLNRSMVKGVLGIARVLGVAGRGSLAAEKEPVVSAEPVYQGKPASYRIELLGYRSRVTALQS